MALIGNQLASSENNSYRVMDNLASFTLTFDGSSSANVLASTDTIALSQHPFITGQRVTYSSGGGSPIGGLLSGTAYYITKTDQNSFKLASSYVNAITNITIDLVGTGTGVTHSFNVAFDGVNTKFKATYSNGTKCTISRAAQLDIAINGVVQQPYDSNPPPNGFTIEADATIVFSTAPLAGYTFWGKALSGSTASVENSDNSIDNFTGNGSTTNFTLSKTPANSQNVLVTINGVTQYPSDATGTRSYSTNANVLVFTAAPANGSLIQVRYIGFAGPTSSNVTGFYGRTGNVVLNSSDGIGVGTAKIGTGIVGLATALLVEGNVRITGILTIGTSSITFDGINNTINVGGGATVGFTTTGIRVGNTFLSSNAIGLGQTTTTGRNAGIGTAIGTLIYNSSTGNIELYNGNAWTSKLASDNFIQATGGQVIDYTQNLVQYRTHIFSSSGTFNVSYVSPTNSTVEYLVVAGGGGAGGNRGGGGGAGGLRTGIGLTVSSSPGSYAITIGSGGSGQTPSSENTAGNSSVFSTITSDGGGRGGGNISPPGSNYAGGNGGSGGGSGSAAAQSGGAGNTPPVSPPQGNPGGSTPPSVTSGGGGGGAGAAGTNANGSVVPGGAGASSSISGSPITYSTGGAGGNGVDFTGGGANATINTGNGGDGGSGNVTGGTGGSGIVIIRYQIGNQSVKATGGTVSYSGGKTIHTFLSSGTFTVTNPSLTSVDYLVVAGGGGGGPASGDQVTGSGGGGAGGYRTGSGFPVSNSPGSYTITVGAGGAGKFFSPSSSFGASGFDSIFSTITSTGGGGGAGADVPTGTWPTRNGGSGGGGGGSSSAGAFGAGNTPPVSPPQGNNGGTGIPGSPFGGGGGGGASAAGTPGPGGGGGGTGGTTSISGASTTYAVGGQGWTGPGNNPITGIPASFSTGNGGPGAPNGRGNGGNGGSGIVIISYPS